MKSTIEEIKRNGDKVISCDNLIAYLNEIQNSTQDEPSTIDIEKYKADLQNWVDANKYQHEGRLEMFRSVITAGQSALKSSFLLNGGSAAAMLAFVAHLAEFNQSKVSEFSDCLIPFVLGVLIISITSGFTYLSQWFYASNSAKCKKLGFVFNLVCIFLGLSTYGFFIWGICRTYTAFHLYS